MANRTMPAGQLTRLITRALRPGRLLLFVGYLMLYLLATCICLALTWLIPGGGLEILSVRALVGLILPGLAAVLLQPTLRRRGLGLLASALLWGMVLVGLACAGGAIGMARGFRL